MTMDFLQTDTPIQIIKPNGKTHKINASIIKTAIDGTHLVFSRFAGFKAEFDIDVFELLGMRNLSAFVGEVFVAAMVKASGGMLKKNPHQDGYPDLLLCDAEGRQIMKALTKSGQMREKGPFSNFANGGIEVKATCGSVPSATHYSNRGQNKPGIGTQRILVAKGYDWKAHHRETNNLMGIYWDFIDGVPAIAAVFFSNALTVDDWGKIVQPRDGGGRTTSVSIMQKSGIAKMYDGWRFVINDERYVNFFDKKNKKTSMRNAVVKER
jgi:hypothetical protein